MLTNIIDSVENPKSNSLINKWEKLDVVTEQKMNELREMLKE